VALDPDLVVGAALRAIREAQGLSLDEISLTTRVRVAHLAALEASAMELLPSRPFTIGYVRAYAKALGLDADATAARFRAENPSPDDDLHSPVGSDPTTGRRPSWLAAVAIVAALAVGGWNLVQHVSLEPRRKASGPIVHILPRPASAGGPFQAAAPLPAPPEATAPEPYVTPGLQAAQAGLAGAPVAPSKAAPAPAPTNAVDPSAPPSRFVADGSIYGPADHTSGLIIQAHKAISLEVRGKGGVVYFARELAAGEAYRVPDLPDLTAEVSNPASAELFEGGISRGLFTQVQTPLKPSAQTGGPAALPLS
jgi:transcriptional regulator with XRE-family HTH domain